MSTPSLEFPQMDVATFVALLQVDDTVELASGLQRCRDAVSRGNDGGALASAYLEASPNATELLALWDAGAGWGAAARSARVTTLAMEVATSLIACADGSEEAESLAFTILKTRARSLSAALSATSPRAARSALKLLAAAARCSSLLSRELLRRVALPADVLTVLAGTRSIGGAWTTTGSSTAETGSSATARGPVTKKAARAVRASGGSAALDAGARAAHEAIHGRPGDDVRGCLLRLWTALLSSGTPECVREIGSSRLRASFRVMLDGLASDPVRSALAFVSALGDAFLLANPPPPSRVAAGAWGPANLIRLSTIYERPLICTGDQSDQEDEMALRHAAHALLVGLSTGRVPSREEILSADEASIDGSGENEFSAATTVVDAATATKTATPAASITTVTVTMT